MSVKSWVLERAHRINGLAARNDLPKCEPAADGSAPPATRSGSQANAADAVLAKAEHLGAYAGLIGAIRDELEHFVASHVRLHLAIAERDRFLLTSIDVHCRDAGQARQRLKEFMHEFKPEQVKRYLAREVIAGLPNAAAIDLSQFAGLMAADDAALDAQEGGEYRELLEALRSTPASIPLRPFEVSVVGRWAELDAARPAASAPARAAAGAAPLTPMAGQRCEFDLEDADGRRRVVLQAVVPGRRFVIGKGEGCDIRVNATYASRRHAEIWLDDGAWWVADAGSTNGLRVEAPDGAAVRQAAVTSATEQALALVEGARIVLSARAEGPAHEYPWLGLRPSAQTAARITPIAMAALGALTAGGTLGKVGAVAASTAAAASAAPKTPLTAILAAPPAELVFTLTAVQSSGVRTLGLHIDALPVSVGRSRNQSLVVDRQHEGVSGHHLDITDLDDDGAEVAVHGDNGVSLDGVHHGPGTRLRWAAGQTLVLGASPDDAPTCRLTLGRVRQAGEA